MGHTDDEADDVGGPGGSTEETIPETIHPEVTARLRLKRPRTIPEDPQTILNRPAKVHKQQLVRGLLDKLVTDSKHLAMHELDLETNDDYKRWIERMRTNRWIPRTNRTMEEVLAEEKRLQGRVDQCKLDVAWGKVMIESMIVAAVAHRCGEDDIQAAVALPAEGFHD